MFTPPAFALDDPDMLAALIAQARLGVLVTHGPTGLCATHLPFLHDRERGVLLAHMARANRQRGDAGDGEAMVVFCGPDAYVSPNWYPSKAKDGKQVPTWNYEAVHVHGRLRWIDDRDGLLSLVEQVSDHHEQGRPHPWRVSDAPADYVERLLRGIIGVEIAITRIEATRKLSQNKPDEDRAGVIAALSASPDPLDQKAAERMRTDWRFSACRTGCRPG